MNEFQQQQQAEFNALFDWAEEQAENAYNDYQAEMSYQESVKEERISYQLRQIGLAPSMVRKIDLSIPF